RAIQSKLQFSVHIVLDQGDVVILQQVQELGAPLLGQTSADGIAESRHHHKGFYRIVFQRLFEQFEINPIVTGRRNGKRADAETFQYLENSKEAGRLDGNDFTRASDGPDR